MIPAHAAKKNTCLGGEVALQSSREPELPAIHMQTLQGELPKRPVNLVRVQRRMNVRSMLQVAARGCRMNGRTVLAFKKSASQVISHLLCTPGLHGISVGLLVHLPDRPMHKLGGDRQQETAFLWLQKAQPASCPA